jgi:D-inositol-3-phosphate glycosyltransferase
MPVPRRYPKRVATISVHTSPLEQPGTGDAGGLNVYVVEVAKLLAERGVEVDIFTRAAARDQPPVVELAPGVLVKHIVAGPFEDLDKAALPGQLCEFTFEVLREEAAHAPGRYDLVHGHYWLSGQVGAVAKERWGVPLVQSMHTLGRVKNAALAAGDSAEPDLRIRGEAEVIATADRIVANTSAEARELTRLYDADPRRVATVSPGVDLSVFTPGSQRQARWQLGIDQEAIVLMFAGRVQPLKAPDVLLQAAARLVTDHDWLADRLVVAFVGGPSGTGRNDPDSLTELAAELGISRNVRLEPPCPQADLADWYRAASLVVVPSYSESFGLVAVEAQACGTPVVAAAAGGLRTAVRDGFSGVLVDGHDPARYAKAIWHLISDPGKLARLALGARQHASGFGWSVTVDQLLGVYGAAMSEVTAGAAPVDA